MSGELLKCIIKTWPCHPPIQHHSSSRVGRRRGKLEAIDDDDDDEEAIIVEGKVMLFGESMVSGGNTDGEQMQELEAAGLGYSGEGGHSRIGRRERECYNALEIIRFTDTPHIFSVKLDNAWYTLSSRVHQSLPRALEPSPKMQYIVRFI